MGVSLKITHLRSRVFNIGMCHYCLKSAKLFTLDYCSPFQISPPLIFSGFPFGPHLVDPINSSMMGGPAAASVGGGPTCNTSSAASNPDPSVKVTLENEDLWRRFHEIGTEMIITKMGR